MNFWLLEASDVQIKSLSVKIFNDSFCVEFLDKFLFIRKRKKKSLYCLVCNNFYETQINPFCITWIQLVVLNLRLKGIVGKKKIVLLQPCRCHWHLRRNK